MRMKASLQAAYEEGEQKMKTRLNILALALAIVCTQFGAAQTFKKVNVSGNVPLVQVSAGGASVWALASNGHPYVLSGKTFVVANSISLSQIAIGGGSAVQADAVWALNSSGSIFRAHKSGTSWVFSQVPGSLDLIAVGPGYEDSCHPYEVWGLNPSAEIFRYDYCANNFVQVPGTLCDIHVGSGDVWGAECGPSVFRFNFARLVFDQINDPFVSFPALTVGVNDIWAVDTANSKVFRYSNNNQFFVEWFSGAPTQIQAGEKGVWGLGAGKVWHLDPRSGFVQVTGSLVSISVGCAGVWGINSGNQVFAFSTP